MVRKGKDVWKGRKENDGRSAEWSLVAGWMSLAEAAFPGIRGSELHVSSTWG